MHHELARDGHVVEGILLVQIGGGCRCGFNSLACGSNDGL